MKLLIVITVPFKLITTNKQIQDPTIFYLTLDLRTHRNEGMEKDSMQIVTERELRWLYLFQTK